MSFLPAMEEVIHSFVGVAALEELTLAEFKQYSDLFEQDVFAAIDLTACCEGRTSYGGPCKESVLAQIAEVREKIG